MQLKPDVEKVGHSYGFMMDYPKLLTGFYFCLVLGIFRRDEKLAEIGKGKIVGYIAGFVFSVIWKTGSREKWKNIYDVNDVVDCMRIADIINR